MENTFQDEEIIVRHRLVQHAPNFIIRCGGGFAYHFFFTFADSLLSRFHMCSYLHASLDVPVENFYTRSKTI